MYTTELLFGDSQGGHLGFKGGHLGFKGGLKPPFPPACNPGWVINLENVHHVYVVRCWVKRAYLWLGTGT